MEEENVTSAAEESALLKEYQELQKNSVSKEKYEHDLNELKEKNAIYLKAITEGGKVDAPEDNSGSVQDAIADLSKFKGNNLEYWQKMVPAMDKTLNALPESEIAKMIGSDGLDELIKVKEGMRKMVEDSQGDAGTFMRLYNARVQDSAPRISSEIERAGGLGNYLEAMQNKK